MRWLIIPLSFLLFACNAPDERFLPGMVGASGDIVVVMPEKYWGAAPGDSIRSAFERSYPLLPQAESSLSIQYVKPKDFDRFWKPHRNVLYVDLDPRLDAVNGSIKIKKSVHAKGQLYAEIAAKTPEAFFKTFSENVDYLMQLIAQEELVRLANVVKEYSAENIMSSINKDYGISMVIPRDANIKKSNAEFLWVDRQMTRSKGNRKHDVQQGFFIYLTPYVADSVFTPEYLLSRRDEVLKKYVPGSKPDSYMTTQYRYQPVYAEIKHKGEYALEMKGLWKMEGEFMGGPFVSMTKLHPETGMLITIEGYAYAPYFNKREYIREAEAIVKSSAWSKKGQPASPAS